MRALWADKPLLWHIYPQDDGAHAAKLVAFLDWLQADGGLRTLHHAWNPAITRTAHEALPLMDLTSWAKTAQLARQRLLQMDDLSTQLTQFVRKKQ